MPTVFLHRRWRICIRQFLKFAQRIARISQRKGRTWAAVFSYTIMSPKTMKDEKMINKGTYKNGS